MGYQGLAYTWSNKKGGTANISEQLDRVLVNLKWHLKYPNSAVFHLPRFSSDHLPVLLKPTAEVKTRTTMFRTENWWALDEEFNKICDELRPTQESDWKKLTGVFRGKVRRWLWERRTPHKMLLEIESEMEEKRDPGTVTKEEEEEIQHRHRRCLVMNEEYWRQRARINWMVAGDNNSKFFHAMAVSRKRRNQINALLVDGDHWETCPTIGPSTPSNLL